MCVCVGVCVCVCVCVFPLAPVSALLVWVCFVAQRMRVSVPQRLLMPFSMSGQHKLWSMEKSIHKGAAEALVAVAAPCPVDFCHNDASAST